MWSVAVSTGLGRMKMTIRRWWRNFRRRRDWNRLDEPTKILFTHMGVSPDQLEQKEKDHEQDRSDRTYR